MNTLEVVDRFLAVLDEDCVASDSEAVKQSNKIFGAAIHKKPGLGGGDQQGKPKSAPSVHL